MKRKSTEDIDSLDLLLDTMCNTFGGIILTALLLVILAKEIEDTPIDPSQVPPNSTPIISKKTSGSIENRVQKLYDMIAETSETATMDNSFKIKIQTEISRLNHDLDQKKIVQMQLKNQFDTNRRDIQNLERELMDLNQQNKNLIQSRQRSIRLPVLHPIQKKTVLFGLRYQHLYAIHDLSRKSSSKRNLNERDINVTIDAHGNKIIHMQKGKGQVITNDSKLRGSLYMALKNLNPQKEYVVFAVYKDSFKEFNMVKKLFVEKGFDYNWQIYSGPIKIVSSSQVYAQ